MKNAKWLIMLMMVLISPGAFAQGGNADNSTLLIAVIVVGVLALIVLLVSIYTLQVLNVAKVLAGVSRFASPRPEPMWW